MPLKLNSTITFTLFLLIIFQYAAHAQKLVKGNISDQFSRPLSGVTVQQKDTKFATLSRADGSFQFSVSTKNIVLIFQKTGYQTVEKTISGETSGIQVVLEKILVDSNRVVQPQNLGFYTENENNTSLLNTRVNLKNVGEYSISELLDYLPGVEAKPQNAPGERFTVSLRGIESLKSNAPLIILDGVVLAAGINVPENMTDLNQLDIIDPENIKNISVLKESAATAIYGSQGANGVILVESKSGLNNKPGINVFIKTGIKLPHYSNTLLKTADYIKVLDNSLLAAGMEVSGLNENTETTNWPGEIIRTGFENNFGFNTSAGNNKSGFYLSGNIKNTLGVLGKTKYNNAKLFFNGQTSLGNFLDLKLGLHAGNSKQSGVLNPVNQFNKNPFIYAQKFPPVSGFEVSSNTLLFTYFKENEPAKWYENLKNDATESRYTFNFQMTFNLSKSLSFQTSATSDYSNFGLDSRIYYEKLPVTFFGKPVFQEKTGILYNWYINNVLKFEKKSDKKNLVLLFGSSENYTKATLDVNYNDNLYSPSSYFNDLQNGNWELKGTNSRRAGALFFQGHFSRNNKYNLTTSVRREQILRQNGVVLFGIFPSVSSGVWLFKQEDETIHSILSGIKLNLSWGISGAETLTNLNYTTNAPAYENALSFYPGELSMPNQEPNNRWENTEEWNFGLQTNLLQNSLTLKFNYFDRLRNNVAFIDYNPKSTVASLNWINSGRISNSGWEFQAEYQKQYNQVQVFAGFHVLSAQNKVLQLAENMYESAQYIQGVDFGFPIQKLIAGESLGNFRGYIMEGIFQSESEIEAANNLNADPLIFYQDKNTAPGDIRFKDLDNNGFIDENDITSVGNALPDFTYGINAGISAGQFDGSIIFDGSAGNEIYNLNKTWSLQSGGAGNRSAEMLESWSLLNSSNQIPRVHFLDPNLNNRPHSGMVEKAGYFRLSSLNLGYTFEGGMNNKKLRAFLTLSNLFAVSAYSGNYPKIGGFNAQGYNATDYGWYPGSRTILIGFSLKL